MIIRRARTQSVREALAGELIAAEVGRRENREVIGPWVMNRPGAVRAQV